MSTASLRPLPRHSSTAPGAALALLMHVLLLGALALSVRWKVQAPTPVSAELWAAVPRAAEQAPTQAPEPPPVPPATVPDPQTAAAQQAAAQAQADAQIAIEAAAREAKAKAKAQAKAEAKALRERQAAEEAEREAQAAARAEAAKEKKQRKAKEDAATRKAAEQAEDARLAKQREANLQRMLGQVAGATGTSVKGADAQDAAPSAAYAGRVVARIKPNILFTGTLAGNTAAEIEVKVGPNGQVLSSRLVKSSGHPEWDDAVLRAIERTATMPRDTDGRVPPLLLLAIRPQN